MHNNNFNNYTNIKIISKKYLILFLNQNNQNKNQNNQNNQNKN